MSAYLHHVAFNVKDIDWYLKLFKDVFGMNISKTSGESPNRKIRLTGGIQLNENACKGEDVCFEHIAIAVEDIYMIVNLLCQKGCKHLSRGKNWVQRPNNIAIELPDK